MSADFFDGDLLKNGRVVSSDQARERLARQKEDLSGQVAGAVKEIEELRMRQAELEKERSDLEEMARKQEEYERGKRDMMAKLRRSLITLEKEEVQAARMVEIISVIRTKYSDTLVELDRIEESSWTDDNFQMELNKALVLVEDAKSVYRKGMAKIEAASWHKTPEGAPTADGFADIAQQLGVEKGFGYWLKVGLAVSLPLMLCIGVLFVLLLLFLDIISF